jgi:hypothetical protein
LEAGGILRISLTPFISRGGRGGFCALLFLPILALLALLYLICQIPVPGHARLDLTDPDSGRSLLTLILPEGAPATLTWHNSLFGQTVTETYRVRAGQLLQDGVTFADPRDPYRMPATPADIPDLYHTGGSFSATGLNRPFSQISFLISEIGDPQFEAGGRVVAFKQAVGFGGRVKLTIRVALVGEAFFP